MFVLLKSGTSASQEEAVEDVKKCRSTTRPWCLSTLMPEDGPSLFHDRIGPRSHLVLSESLSTTLNHIYVFSKPLLTATLYFFILIRLGEKRGTPSESF